MNDPDFEEQFGQQKLRSVPPAWRREILAAATERPSTTFEQWLRRLLWPHPIAWGALTAVWLFIFGVNFFNREAGNVPQQIAAQEKSAQRLALAEQRRLWLELTASDATVGETANIPRRRREETRPRSQGLENNQAA